MRRRAFLAGAAAALQPLRVAAQTPAKLPRVGVLSTTPPSDTRLSQAFLQELRKLGWVDGQNVVIDWKVTRGQVEKFEELAVALVRARTDVIVAPNPNAVLAARKATASIPIVMVNTTDPVQLGIIASLSQPGGNVTGTSSLSADVSAKQVELIKEFLPDIVRLVVLSVPSNPWHPHALAAIHAAARTIRIEVVQIPVRGLEDFPRVFTDIARDRQQGVLVLTDPMTFFHRVALADFSLRYRAPAVYGLREYAEAGGLMSYWADHEALYRRTAAYVDKLLKGEKAETLPVEQPTKYEFVINMRTATALGLEVPPALFARADEVIE